MAVTLTDIQAGVNELEQGKTVCVKLALWAGLLSANAPLYETNAQMKVLRRYAKRRLPPSDKLKALLAGTGLTNRKLDGLYRIEALEFYGLFTALGLADIGATYADQKAWREHVASLMTGHGMAFKTISFAAMLISPSTCELIPVDRHVLARLHLPETFVKGNSRPAHDRYEMVECFVQGERDEHAPNVSGAVWHWLVWEQWRQDKGVSGVASGCETHQYLSCRI